MSKRLCISLKDSEYKTIEEEAKKRGIKPIDIINNSIKDSLEIENVSGDIELLSKSLNEAKKEIDDLKKVVIHFQKMFIETTRVNIENSSYIKVALSRILTNAMKSLDPNDAAKKMDEIVNESIIDSKKNFDKIMEKFWGKNDYI